MLNFETFLEPTNCSGDHGFYSLESSLSEDVYIVTSHIVAL